MSLWRARPLLKHPVSFFERRRATRSGSYQTNGWLTRFRLIHSGQMAKADGKHRHGRRAAPARKFAF